MRTAENVGNCWRFTPLSFFSKSANKSPADDMPTRRYFQPFPVRKFQ